MSSDEADKKNVEEPTNEAVSSAEENEEKEEEEKPKEEKVNNKTAAKKKAADSPKIKQPPKKRVKSDQEEKETKKEDKKDNKKKAAEKEEEEEEEDESGDENDVNHKSVPLLDQPLEISGKRRSKEVQRFKPVAFEDENKEVKIPEGKGAVLGEIERIEFNIQRAKPDDLKLLHRLIFSKPGKAATVKKILKQFNGFEYSVGSDEYKKKKEAVDKSFKKVTVAQLKNVCNILDIERGGSKDELIERILKFITCPIDSGKKLPGGGRSKRKGASNKNYEEGEERKSKKRGKAKKKEVESEESEKEDEDDEVDEDEEKEDKKEEEKKKKDATSEDESEEEKEEKVEKPKKGAKKGKKAAEAADKKAPPKKRAAAKKAAEKSDSEAEADGENDSDDDEPLIKKAKDFPSDEDIKTYVKSLLEGANLELITMKKVCQDVYAHYPDFDLAPKKDFIKTTVKNLISS